MTITDETTNDLKCPVDGCGYEALDDPTKWTKDPSSRLSQHIKRSHPGVDPGAAVAAVMLGEPFEQPEAPPSVDDGPEGPGPYSENGAADAPDTEEVPPTPTDSPGRSATVDEPARRRGPFNRAREVVKGRRKPKSDEQGPATGEKPPKRTRTRSKRISASDLLADLAGWTGRQVQRTGHVPTGRMITWQAPVTGEIIDDVIADTALDRVVVQRLVAARGTLDLLVAVFGPPLVTYQLERALAQGAPPAVLEQLEATLKGVIRESLPTLLPAMKRARAKETKVQKDLVQLFDEADLLELGVFVNDKGEPVDAGGHKVDVADLFVAMLFQEWQPTVVETTAVVMQPEGVPQ